VLLTVTSLEDDQIRVNVIPKKLKEGENSALTTPMSFTGTAVELDDQLPNASRPSSPAILNSRTHSRAREEMDAAAKAAQELARNKAKSNKKPSSESARKIDPAANEGQKKEPPGCLVSSISRRRPRHRRRHPTRTMRRRRTSWRRSRTRTTIATPVMKKRTKPLS
jgi:PRTRC genetic system protein E